VNSTSYPLSGVVVADFSRVLAGPLATMTLADLGATVIKVERPGAGDDTRAWGPPWRADDQTAATYFDSVNRSKLSVGLDLGDPADAELARELARRADVLVENFKPEGLRRLGLGYEQVSARNPGVVYCSITGFGTGAGADLLGYDFVVQAVGGLMSITGEPGSPSKAGVALVDVLTGKDATIAVRAGVAARARTGRGCHVELTLLTSLLSALVNQVQAHLGAGVVPTSMGNQHPSIAPYETLRCADGLLAIACGNDGQFARLATVLGIPEVATQARFATNAARVVNRQALIEVLQSRLATHGVAHWQARLVQVGVPAGQVGSIADGVSLAEELGLAPVVDAGGVATVRHPARYSTEAVRPPSRPPRLAEHDDQVRAWLHDPDRPLPQPASDRSPKPEYCPDSRETSSGSTGMTDIKTSPEENS
jgi:formyl-CoA transferase